MWFKNCQEISAVKKDGIFHTKHNERHKTFAKSRSLFKNKRYTEHQNVIGRVHDLTNDFIINKNIIFKKSYYKNF